MWHEARRREKATQKLFNDHKKRAERRREENRVDPNSYLQVNGVKAKLCLDPNIYKQAATSMVAWQGDSKLMIDRFDVRTTLESIPKGSDVERSKRDRTTKNQSSSRQTGVLDIEETKPMRTLLDYERYRLLIQNDLHDVAEESRLNLIAKSDIISDAKFRKLKGNRFGTSGETTSMITSEQASFQSKSHLTRRTPINGPTYNSVPPPSSLTNSQSSSLSRSSWKSLSSNEQKPESSQDIPNLASEIIDLDEYDNMDLDQVDTLREDSKQIGDVAKKYGLSSEELILLSKLDNKEANLKESIVELKVLAKKLQINKEKVVDTSQQIYGPVLPPKLAKAADQLDRRIGISSDDGSSSDKDRSDSPVPQRSPSGATMIPLRKSVVEVSDDNRDSSDDNDKIEDKKLDTVEISQSLQPIVTQPEPKLIPESINKVPSDSPANDSHIKGRDRTSSPQPENQQQHRRASTPLAYKKNCRSSRSLSRERRKTESKNKYHGRRKNSSSSSSSLSPYASHSSSSYSRSRSPYDRNRYHKSRSRSTRYHNQEDRSRKRVRDR